METWGGGTPFLMIEGLNAQPDDELQVRVRDDSGREAKVEMNGYWGLPGALRTYIPAFVPSEGAMSVTVTILLNRPLAFDFLVSPAEVRAQETVR